MTQPQPGRHLVRDAALGWIRVRKRLHTFAGASAAAAGTYKVAVTMGTREVVMTVVDVTPVHPLLPSRERSPARSRVRSRVARLAAAERLPADDAGADGLSSMGQFFLDELRPVWADLEPSRSNGGRR